jgi:hypothetical protein
LIKPVFRAFRSIGAAASLKRVRPLIFRASKLTFRRIGAAASLKLQIQARDRRAVRERSALQCCGLIEGTSSEAGCAAPPLRFSTGVAASLKQHLIGVLKRVRDVAFRSIGAAASLKLATSASLRKRIGVPQHRCCGPH